MSDVLFDAPGPRGRRRIRIASSAALALLLLLVLLMVRRFSDHGQFEPRVWEPFAQWSIVKFLLGGLWATVRVAIGAMLASTVVGTLFAVWRMSRFALLRWLATTYVLVFRSVPVLLLIYFSFQGIPGLGERPAVALGVGLTLYNSAVIAEVVRAGIVSLDRGQSEAAYAIGLTHGQTLRFVLLPQAARRMAPALVSQLVIVLKDTSLGFVIGYDDLLRRAGSLAEYYSGTLLSSYLIAAAMYIALNFVLSAYARRLARTPKSAGAMELVEKVEQNPGQVPAGG